MKKVLLFGTGNGAKMYLSKYENNFELLGIFDNDKQKQGKVFKDKLFISCPSTISTYKYEQIIIVSQWANEIYKQLVNELNVEESKIHIPPKRDIKEANRPFEDKNTRELARKIIRKLSYYAIKDKVPLIVDFGTLLGIVRDKDIIKWDDDIDFSIVTLPSDKNFEKWIKSILERINLPVKLSVRSKLVDGKATSFLLYFENEKYRNFLTSISLRELEEGKYLHLPSGGMWYAPQKYFDSFEKIRWQNSNILVPNDCKNYLKFLYGDWQIPKKDISMTDYANLGEVKYDNFIGSGDGYKEIN